MEDRSSPGRLQFPRQPRRLQGPRPPRLEVRQVSHAVKQLSGAPEQSQAQGHEKKGKSPRDAVPVYDVPVIIHIDRSEFRAIVQRLTGQRSGSLPSKAQTQDHQKDDVVQGPPELLLQPVAPTSPRSLERAVRPSSPADTTAKVRFDAGLKRRSLQQFRSQDEQTRQAKKKKLHHTEAPICALVDAMFRLPAKLDGLLASHGNTLPQGAEEEIPLIKQDLEKMVAILQEQDDSGAEDHSMMVKCLTKEVRELSYDMEDSVDQYVHAADSRRGILSPRRTKYKITRRKSKLTKRRSEKLKWRLWMANKIREFSMRSQDALQRCSLFKHLADNGISGSSAGASFTRSDASFRSRHPTPYGEPVGIDEHVNKLQEWLGKDRELKLKVVSVVGSGGIGKTTLVKELYRRIGGQFECRAFVRTSRKPDVRRILISMLSQIRPHQPPHSWKMHSLIADIRTHLQDKRYLIVIDDVWATQTWDIINHALPAGNLCSGILITTEVDDVALICCGYESKYVLTMKPLGHDDSSKLFIRTAFGPQYECPSELSEAAHSIVRKCAGLPLAMVTVASLLVSEIGKPEQWDYVNESLGYGLKTNPISEGMKEVLNLSYNNLPQHLKACVMYLSIYEEDYIIQKDDLVKQWMAEGLIRATEEEDMEEISRICFSELISSRMIQPVHINDNGDVLSCTVHHIILDFIKHKSLEENFVTAIDHFQTTAPLVDKVRRLSLHFGNAEASPPTNMRLSQVRTLAFFGVIKCLPYIVEFGLLQILILHLWGNDEWISFDLSRISELFRLRYLHVTCNSALELPQTQMRGLQYLETLKIDARVSSVPSDIVHLPSLLHLSLPVGTNLPNGIDHMISLRTLEYFDLSVNSMENVHNLGELTNLRDLRLTCSSVPSSYLQSKMDNIGSILANLSNLRSVTLKPSGSLESGPSSMSISCDGLSSVSSPLTLLQKFEWLPRICTFSRIPKWIGHLNKLCILKIGVRELVSNDVNALGVLPALTVLSLYIRAKPVERIIFTKTGFLLLKCFKFRCSVPWLEFEADAMPNLLKLKLVYGAHGVDQHGTIPVGIMHLTCLKEIFAKIGGAGDNDPDRRAAESALIDAIKMHPARPTFSIHCLDGMFSSEDDDIKKEDSVEHVTLQKQYDIKKEESIEHTTLQKQYDIKKEDSIEHTTLQKQYEIKKEHMTLQKQHDIKKEDSSKQHEVLPKDYKDDANKHAHKRKTPPKWSTQVRVNSLQEIEGHDDGFSWRKYGQKDILGSKYPRGYYRCKHRNTQGCQAMKQLQSTDDDPLLLNATYSGIHICIESMNSQPQPGHEQSSISVGVKAKGSVPGLEKMRPWRSKRSIQVRARSMQEDYPVDGYSWRKYGQKTILGSKHPRCYFKCMYKRERGCNASKQTQRTDDDPELLDVVYQGEHTCGENDVDSITTGARFMSPATCAGSQATHERGSRSTTRDPFVSPGMSQSQVAYKFTDPEFWSVPDDVDSMPNSPVDEMMDLNADFVDDTGYFDS